MTHNPELLEAAANVAATLRRLIENLGAKPPTDAGMEDQQIADRLIELAMELGELSHDPERYAAPVESEGGEL